MTGPRGSPGERGPSGDRGNDGQQGWLVGWLAGWLAGWLIPMASITYIACCETGCIDAGLIQVAGLVRQVTGHFRQVTVLLNS